jgi:hypothetical protein
MCKQINFAIAAAAVGLAITFWAKSHVVVITEADIIHPNEDLLPVVKPCLPIQDTGPSLLLINGDLRRQELNPSNQRWFDPVHNARIALRYLCSALPSLVLNQG